MVSTQGIQRVEKRLLRALFSVATGTGVNSALRCFAEEQLADDDLALHAELNLLPSTEAGGESSTSTVVTTAKEPITLDVN